MCYNEHNGTFPLSLEECTYIKRILCKEIADIENDMGNKDPHKYILIKMINAKIDGFIQLMNARSIKEKLKEVSEITENRTYE